MSTPLEITARQCLFIVRDGIMTKKVPLPSEWQTALVTNDEQLWACVQQSKGSGHKRILLLSEETVDATLKILRGKASADPNIRLGCVVISKDPERWDPLESTCRHASLSIL